MAITVTIRVSRNLEQRDLDALRNWLQHDYPGEWTLTTGAEAEGTLGAGDDLLETVLDGAASGAARATLTILYQEFTKWRERTRKKYPAGAKPDAELTARDESGKPVEQREQ